MNTFDRFAADKTRIIALIAASGVPGLFVTFDDDERTVSLASAGRQMKSLLRHEAEEAISNWPGSRVIGWTPAGNGVMPVISVDGSRKRGLVFDLDGHFFYDGVHVCDGGDFTLVEALEGAPRGGAR